MAIYENECTRQEVGEQIRSAFEVSGTEMENGKFWIPHRVVSERVLNCTFIEWITSGAINEKINANIYRMNLFVISDYNITSLKKLIDLIYSDKQIIGFYIPLLCLNNEVNILKKLKNDSKVSYVTKEILRCLLKLCIIIKNRMYYFSISMLALVSFRMQLWSRLLIKLVDSINFQNKENHIKFVVGEIVIRHFYEDLRIYESVICKPTMKNFDSIEETEQYVFSHCFTNYISLQEISVMWIIEKLSITFDEWNRLCLKCVGTTTIVSPNCYHRKSMTKYHFYRHPTFNYNPLSPMIKEYDSLLKHCQVLVSESPLLAIETYREIIDSVDFDALYENEEICEQISDKVRITMYHDDTQQEIGKLKTPHRIVKDFVINCLFPDWFRNEQINETFNLSPYRIHLFVIRDNDYNFIQIRNILELVYSKRNIRFGIFIPLIYTTRETFYKIFENLNSKLEQSPFISTAEQINLFNCVFQFSIVVLNENYYLGRYTIPLLTFPKLAFANEFTKLCRLVNPGKSIDNNLELLKVIFNSLFIDTIDYARLAASYVNEMTYELACAYLSNELNYDVNKFENAQRYAVCTLVFSQNWECSMESIFHFFFIRTNLAYLINFFKIIWLLFGVPIFYLVDTLKIGNQTSMAIEEEFIFLQIAFQDSNLKHYLSNILIEVIKIHDMYGDTVNLSIEHLINVRGFVELIRCMEDLTRTIASTRLHLENIVSINSLAKHQQSTFYLKFPTRKQMSDDLFRQDGVMPLNIRQRLAELVILDSNQMTSQNDEQFLL